MAAIGEKPFWKTLWSKWKKVLEGILDPVILLMLAASIFLTQFSYLAKDNVIKVFLSILAMLATGILGAKALHYYETRKREEKGKSAIRSLKVMMNDLTKLEKRVTGFLSRVKSGKHCFEEILDKAISLQGQTLVSIENWTDVFPDADVKTLVGEWFRAAKELEIVLNEKQRIEADLGDLRKAKEIDKARISELEKDLSKKKDQIFSVSKTVDQKSIPFNTGLLSGLNLNSSTLAVSSPMPLAVASKRLTVSLCKKCGNVYSWDDFSPDSGYCEKCRGFQKKD